MDELSQKITFDFMKPDNQLNALQARFQKLCSQYETALQKDVQFEEVKKIYQQLQEIKRKLNKLKKKKSN